jgi:hypothetical protein
MERCSFRLEKKSQQAYIDLKEWCRANRVPLGRMMNAALRAMVDAPLPDYNRLESPKQAIITILYPRQVDIDDKIRYNKLRARLTRVKNTNIEYVMIK